MIFRKIIKNITTNPKMLFLIDGLGALLSAFLLGVIMTKFQSSFGMPRNTLYFLAFLPVLFAIYDFSCYYKVTKKWIPFLKAIIFANIIYCFISIGLVFFHYQELTSLGLVYFLLEFAIIITLVSVEFKVLAGLRIEEL